MTTATGACRNTDCEHFTAGGRGFCLNCQREELHASLQRLHHTAGEFLIDALYIRTSLLPIDPAVRFICHEVGERLLIMLRLPTFRDMAQLTEQENDQ